MLMVMVFYVKIVELHRDLRREWSPSGKYFPNKCYKE